jgi:hypothetical protein
MLSSLLTLLVSAIKCGTANMLSLPKTSGDLSIGSRYPRSWINKKAINMKLIKSLAPQGELMPVRLRGLANLVCICFLASFVTAQVKNSRPKPALGPGDATPVAMKDDPAFHSELENSTVKVFRVEVAPHASSNLDNHDHDYLVFALSKSNFKVAGEMRTFSMQMAPEEMQVLRGGYPQRLINLEDTPLQIVILEAAKGIVPDKAICGLSTAECTDGEFGNDDKGNPFTDSTLFETSAVKVSRIDLGAGATLPKVNYVQGHVLVALADMKLSDQPTGKDAKEVPLKAGEVFWYESAGETQITNLGDQNAPIITVEFSE